MWFLPHFTEETTLHYAAAQVWNRPFHFPRNGSFRGGVRHGGGIIMSLRRTRSYQLRHVLSIRRNDSMGAGGSGGGVLRDEWGEERNLTVPMDSDTSCWARYTNCVLHMCRGATRRTIGCWTLIRGYFFFRQNEKENPKRGLYKFTRLVKISKKNH